MRRILEAVENCALYAVSTAGDARCVLKVVEVVLYILEVVNGVRCVLEVMLCMLFRMLFRMLLEVVLYALEMLEGMRCVLEAQEVMPCVLFCTWRMLKVLEVMYCVLLCMLECGRCALFAGGCWRCGT